MQICPACAQENPDGFRICGMCGASLLEAPPLAREERKVVTVLFTDLVGFTSRAETLDPEDVRATLSPYYSRLRSEIERHGGTVEKFIGDAVMAVFGAPLAHEDDPERAVRAALAIREAIAELNEATPGLELRIRTAVNTGEALVALGARPAEGEGMVSGDVVNTAARMQSAAPVDGIVAGEGTYRSTRSTIEYREAEPIDAKGKSEPVAIWEVVGARSRFGLDVEDRLRTPLIGRERERSFLVDALERCRTEQTAQLVTLVGVPGIGKSRLVTELFHIVDDDPELITWRQGRSLPYGESMSYWALGEIVKAHVGILETDGADEALGKLAAAVGELFADDAERRWIEAHVRPLAGLASGEAAHTGSTTTNEAFSAWRRLLEAVAERGPLVLVFEDLHWADDGLLDFVDHLADWATGVPLLLVATARPELLERRPGWGGGKRNASTVSIGSLGADDVARLLAALLDQTVLPAEVQSRVLERAEGNPLYAEEYVRMLQDRGLLVRSARGWQLAGLGEIPLPETVQGMIAARLDSLSPAEKELVQDAAVIGKVFWPASLQALGKREAGDVLASLHLLERKEFVRRDRRSAIAGETQHAFLHALVRDVAYAQIPRAQRVERHRLAAEWIESLAPDRTDDRAEMLAHHYHEALTLAAAAGVDAAGVRAAARRAFADAAQRALSLNSWIAAREWARRALDVMPTGDPLRPQMQLLVVRAGANVDELEMPLALEARDAFLEANDLERAAEAEAMISWLCFYLGAPGRYEHARAAVALVEDRPVSLAKANAYAQLARVQSLAGRHDEAISYARQTLDMAEALGSDSIASHALNTLGMSRVYSGEAEGVDDLREAVARAQRANVADEIGKACNNLMNIYWALGRLDDASACWKVGHDTAAQFGISTGVIWFEGEAVLDEHLRGDLVSSLRHAETFLGRGESTTYQQGPALGVRSRARAAQGLIDDALADAARSLELARSIGDPQQLAPSICGWAFALAAAGRRDEANAALDEVLADETALEHAHWLCDLPLLLVELGRADDYLTLERTPGSSSEWRVAGSAAATGDLVGAAEAYGRIGARFNEAWARLLAAERGETAHLAAAHAYFVEQDARPYVRRCEALLSASA
jgi:class 3 adenylate cyclase/tetratricopeptide (TPR) repeat protein